MARTRSTIGDRDTVTSFVKGLEVIRCFTSAHPAMTLTDVSRACGLSRATARRFLLTLVRAGYAELDGKYFRLRPKVLDLGFSLVASLNVGETAQPFLSQLASKLNETCFIAVLDGVEVRYVASADGQRRMTVLVPIGSRAPAYAVSTGRVLLSALDEASFERYLRRVKFEKITPNTVNSKTKLKDAVRDARDRGYSMVDQELEVGLRSLSVPLRNRGGDVVAALNLCCPTARITMEQMRGPLLGELRAMAERITAAMPAI